MREKSLQALHVQFYLFCQNKLSADSKKLQHLFCLLSKISSAIFLFSFFLFFLSTPSPLWFAPRMNDRLWHCFGPGGSGHGPTLLHLRIQSGNSFPGSPDGALLWRADKSRERTRLSARVRQTPSVCCSSLHPNWRLFTVREDYFWRLWKLRERERVREEERGVCKRGGESPSFHTSLPTTRSWK